MKLKTSVTKFVTEELEKYREDYALNLNQVCDDLDIKVFSTKFYNPQTSGAIEHLSNGSWQILIRDSDSLNRKRFTTAHEIGPLYFLY